MKNTKPMLRKGRRCRVLTAWLTAGFMTALSPSSVTADGCSLSGSTETCSGDLSDGVTLDNSSSDFDTLVIENLTATVGFIDLTAAPSTSSSSGTDGTDVTGVGITFDGSSSFGIENDSGSAFNVDFVGGDGAKGFENDGDAGDGGDGGAVSSETTVTVTDATDFTGLFGMDLSVEGGNGGEGGKGKSTSVIAGVGGDGGAGGVAGALTVTIESGDLTSLSGTGGEALFVRSAGGDGGKGGEGKGDSLTLTNVTAGDGGTGGAGGDVTVEVISTLSSTVSTEQIAGIRVESIGGDGGDGGKAEGSGLNASVKGGDGAAAAAGGNVKATVETVTVMTTTDLSVGLLARSYGGNGGDGGEGKDGIDGSGGGGAQGGDAGTVTATFGGTITTSGVDSSGVLIQSVGGFAGDAGSTSGTLSTYGAGSESGGASSNVSGTLVSGTIIKTTGEGADGIYVQSVGGGGGKGESTSGLSTLGGDGSSGGNGSDASATLESDVTITTGGETASAVYVQSFGGGGGSGGSADGITSVGGAGGSGGSGGTVTATITSAELTTTGDSSNTILLSSAGGGGGVAKSTAGINSIGGSGGDGGNGGAVTLTLDSSTIKTEGADSDAVFVQSVGGGGGSGSSSLAIGVEYAHSVGGSGGDGGTGGDVEIKAATTDTGTIVTTDSRARGVVLQSIGGGGGTSGNDYTFSAGVGLDIATGQTSDGGDGNTSGSVTIDSFYHSIQTSGDHAHGVLAQSVGGGGGAVGTAINYDAEINTGASNTNTTGGNGGTGGDAGTVMITINEAVTTGGDQAHGIFAQSVGGGGGASGTTLAGSVVSFTTLGMTSGGSGEAGGDASAVSVTSFGDVSTGGLASYGIYAQSTGGGGGSAGWTSNIDGITTTNLTLTTGGNGGVGGTASDVTVSTATDTTISTTKDGSTAILAQSVGGGGGNTYATVTGSVSSTADLAIAVGGDGGAAGNPGDVTVTNDADIITQGKSSYGILAQSKANSGGNASFTVDASLLSAGSLSANISGSGGTGGDGGIVKVTNNGTISTGADSAVGILAQSNGSGGGSASGTISVSALSMDSLSVNVGGNGGSGGSGGDVTIENYGTVTTTGSDATALLAQSQGGDGGSGGLVVNAGFNASSSVAANVQVGVGGDGGSGAAGGTVTVTNTETLTTGDFMSYGIFAQSIGGSGGKGGSVYSGVLSFSSGTSFEADVTVGGDGGDGGSADTVKVDNSGTIGTSGYGAAAIFAQSVSGNGGTGGSSFAFTGDASTDGSMTVDVTVGGDGGSSSTAGAISVINSGDITTDLDASQGIYAQSVGGSGGSGGSASILLLDKTSGTTGGTTTVTGTVSVGGSGGSGGLANTVDVQNSGSIMTSGEGSAGIWAQSVGGGGGDGGLASASTIMQVADSSTEDSNDSYSLSVTVGGSGSTGGDAEEVTVTNKGNIGTGGVAAYGIFAQSVGGGGGTGGNGDASETDFFAALEENLDVQSAFLDDLATTASIADDVYGNYSSIEDLKSASATSLLSNWTIDIGGSGGSAGAGAEVMVKNEAEITTTGDSGTAILAQSVGGGGGSGGDGSGSVLSQFTLSGDAGSGSEGGAVIVSTSKALKTSGDGAMGIFAQSIGGGGGAAGDVELAFSDFDSDSFGLGVTDSGDGGEGGDGGDVTITTTATITTTGENAHGIWAQSVGGSGGAGGSSNPDGTAVSIVGGGGANGDGGTVNVTIEDEISVTGDESVGIFAQSVGGDDGASDSGDVKVEIKGDITAGDGGQGVVVQSVGSGSSGEVKVTLNKDYTISVGESSSDGDGSYGIVALSTDGQVTIDVFGDIIMSSIDDYAIGSRASDFSGLNDNEINLTGTIYGSIDMDDYTELSMKNGALLEVGTTFKLGDDTEGGTLYLEDGTVSPGGEDNIITTNFYGELVTEESSGQAGEGVFLMDLEMGDTTSDGTSDVIAFQNSITTSSGSTFRPVGTVDVNLTGTNLLASGDSGSVSLFTAASSDSSFSVSELSVDDSSTVDYALSVGSDGSTENITLTYTVDYSSDSADLSENQGSVGDYVSDLVESVQGDGAAAAAPSVSVSVASAESSDSGLLGEEATGAAAAEGSLEAENSSTAFVKSLTSHLLNVQTTEELKDIYDLLGPGEIFATTQTTVLSSLRFDNRLHSCSQIGADGVALYFDEGSCVWGDFYGVYTTRGEEPNTAGYDETVFGFAAGAQQRIEGDWILGAGINYESTSLNATDYSGDGHRVQAAVIVKKELGETTLAGSFSGGFGTYDATRTLFNPAGSTPAQADSDISNHWIAGHARVSHDFHPHPDFLVRPYFDLGVFQFWQGGYSESGGDPYALDIGGFSKTNVTANPMVEVQGNFDLYGMAMNGGARGGVLGFLSSRDVSTQARLQGAGTDGPWFTLSDTDSRVYGQLGATLQGQVAGALTLETSFDTLVSGNNYVYVGSLRANFNF